MSLWLSRLVLFSSSCNLSCFCWSEHLDADFEETNSCLYMILGINKLSTTTYWVLGSHTCTKDDRVSAPVSVSMLTLKTWCVRMTKWHPNKYKRVIVLSWRWTQHASVDMFPVNKCWSGTLRTGASIWCTYTLTVKITFTVPLKGNQPLLRGYHNIQFANLVWPYICLFNFCISFDRGSQMDRTCKTDLFQIVSNNSSILSFPCLAEVFHHRISVQKWGSESDGTWCGMITSEADVIVRASVKGS